MGKGPTLVSCKVCTRVQMLRFPVLYSCCQNLSSCYYIFTIDSVVYFCFASFNVNVLTFQKYIVCSFKCSRSNIFSLPVFTTL